MDPLPGGTRIQDSTGKAGLPALALSVEERENSQEEPPWLRNGAHTAQRGADLRNIPEITLTLRVIHHRRRPISCAAAAGPRLASLTFTARR